jgi:hypothetical protein
LIKGSSLHKVSAEHIPKGFYKGFETMVVDVYEPKVFLYAN